MIVRNIINLVNRNQISLNGEHSCKNQVNLEWWKGKTNVGDYLANVVYEWMLQQRAIDKHTNVGKTKHLLTIGSILAMGNFDATVWGSGIHVTWSISQIFKQRHYRRYDIRAVRGPITKKILDAAGYKCPDIFGDPAILMPLIYLPNKIEKKYDISVVEHLTDNDTNVNDDLCNFINVKTEDYKYFIDEIVSSRKIISSSLHGIILAETYGIPAVFWNKNMNSEVMKFYDWYLGTGRSDIKIANSLDEAINMEPMKLPNLSEMRERLISVFPYDLWETNIKK